MARHSVCVLILVASLSWCVPEAMGQPSADVTREFPVGDEGVLRLVLTGVEAKRRAAEPFSLETIAYVLETAGPGDALPAIRHVIATADADTVARLIEQIGLYVRSRGLAEVRLTGLRASLEPARAAITSLPPEQAAERLRAFRAADSAFEVDPRLVHRRFFEAMRAYPDTRVALLTEVEVITSRPLGADRFDALDRFARNHPGTTAAARALYEYAFQLGRNVSQFGASDPTPRLLRAIEIVSELESGRYPRCEWVDRAAELVTGFSIPDDAQVPPEGVDRMLDGLLRFAASRIDRPGDATRFDSLVLLVTSKMADLHERQGDRLGGVERTLGVLESRVRETGIVRRLRARFYVGLAWSWRESDRAFAATKADETLRALVADDDEPTSRHALATLATLEFHRREYDRALPLFETYIAQHTVSPWAWVAALRVGQTHEAMGRLEEAIDSYDRTARLFAHVPPARVLGDVYAARLYDALGRVDDSLAAHRRAAAAWDGDYGETYALPARAAIGSEGRAATTVGNVVVSRSELAARVETLTQTLARPDSALIERGRWQLEQGSYDEALKIFDAYVARHPDGPGAADAVSLARLARFERALELGASWSSSRDTTAAAVLLEEVVDGPPDFLGSAARLAKSALHAVAGNRIAAVDDARRALGDLLAAQRPLERPTSASRLESDVMAIRDLLFRPAGDLPVYRNGGWSILDFPERPPPFSVVSAAVTVKLPGESARTMSFVQRYTSAPDVLTLTTDEIQTIARICYTIGGLERRVPRGVMAVPNQPTGDATAIVDVWNTLFPMRPGHWGGWVIATYPIVTRIEFIDDERTRATAQVVVGYSGATILLDKVDGRWVAVEATSPWVM
jgi:tetratricopeptide (TPR) repeat protein